MIRIAICDDILTHCRIAEEKISSYFSGKTLTCSIPSDYHCFLHNFLLLPNGASVFSTSYHNVETFSQPLISLKIL